MNDIHSDSYSKVKFSKKKDVMKISSLCGYVALFVLLLFSTEITAQKLESISLGFSDACVSASHNSFPVSFKWTPPLPSATNQYIIELSDANGDFSNPVTLATLTGQNTAYELSTNVQLPTTVYGNAYKIRVSSTNPSSTVVSGSFSAYYVNVNTPMILNNSNSSISLCPGHSQEIVLNKTGEKAYKWYRNNVLIPNETSYKLRVSQAGTYHAVVDYGDYCSGSSNSRSNNVTVTIGSGAGVTLSGSNQTGYICQGQSFTFTAEADDDDDDAEDYTYKWYKNGTLLQQGVGMMTYTTPADNTAAGKYHVGVIIQGVDCEEITNEIEVKFRENFTVSATVDGGTVVVPGVSKTLTAQTTAESPTYQWYLDNAPISGATAATYNATAAGKYKVTVTQGGTCAGVALSSGEIELKNPTSFKVEIKHQSAAYQACLFDRTTLQVAKIAAVTDSGDIVIEPSSYGAFNYRWYKDTTLKGSTEQLQITSAADNGTYKLDISVTGSTVYYTSNTLQVQLSDANAVQLNSGQSTLEFCTATAWLSATPASSTATYTWYKDNVQLVQEVGKDQLEVSQMGSYHVEISGQGGACPAVSNVVVVVKKESRANWVSSRTNQAFISGKTYTLMISHNMTAPSIKWYKDGAEIPGQTGTTLSVTAAGSYNAKLLDPSGCGTEISLPLQNFLEITSLKPTIGYAEVQANVCDGTATKTTMKLKKLDAVLVGGEEVTIGKEGDESDYAYFTFQWMRNTSPISGQTDYAKLEVNKADATNGVYSLLATYTTIISESNKLSVSFSEVPDITIISESEDGNPKICPGGSTVLKAPIDSEVYSYQWYKQQDIGGAVEAIDGAVEATYQATEVGNYYLRMSNGACTKQSLNIIKVSEFDSSSLKLILLDSSGYPILDSSGNPKNVVSGSQITVRKETQVKVVGGNSNASNYLWITPGASLFAETILVKESGEYILTATQGSTCESVILKFTAQVYENNEVPNVVTPNGDGENDTWKLPEKYENKSNVRVHIYSHDGKVEYSGTNYKNDWPNQNTVRELGQRALIYIYVIEVDNKVDKQGTITLFSNKI